MPTDLTFKQVCAFIKKDDSKLIEDMDNLLGLAFACSPLFIGPGSLALLPLIPVKNEITKISKRVFESLKSKKDDDYIARRQRMETAYGFICFSAFFEALDQQIPESLTERIEQRRKNISREEFWGKKTCQPDSSLSNPTMVKTANSLAALTAQFPHPLETLDQQIDRNAELWDKMSKGFLEFVKNSAFWEEAEEKEQAQILAWVEKVPQVAAECFEAQYFELVRRYEDFAVWANLQEHKNTKNLICSLSKYVQQQSALEMTSKTAIDIGFMRMCEVVKCIPETLKISQANEIAEDLKRYYDKEIFDPIAEGVDAHGDNECLCFPRVCDAFIPQSFRIIRWTNKLKSIEDEAAWKNLERREDLGAFLLNYLSSPYSTEAPLIVLGHPGSGKSLLTKVLSAKLMSKHYTIIRVPLREIDADAGIVDQIEERIHQVTSQSIHWAKFSSSFKNNPPLVILDGYDELLQASGRVFSGYLKAVKDFQDNENTLKRPVRVIVTSRITLIDKATIPPGATIVRLLEFDKRQRDQWISIWNQKNERYFKEANIEEFALPMENEIGAVKLLSLAEQPLLLLMLALYDSEGNQLRKSKTLDRTILYDRLLRRFVEREKAKDQEFWELDASARKKKIDLEMQRLAVAALGMYNRRKLHILSSELNEDIQFFDLVRTESSVPVNSGRILTPAELLLGSFFFVHKSKAQVKAGALEYHEENAAFEFLHNTFGEFLTAEFIIFKTLAEVTSLKVMDENDLRLEYDTKLYEVDGLNKEWFASLIYTPLFTRPVILEMMREWIGHELERTKLSKQNFLFYLDKIIVNQIKRLLSKREFPSIMWKEAIKEAQRIPFEKYPLLGHVAIYSINLFLLRITVSSEPFIFDESLICTYEDGARPWDRLTQIWRSWFALDNLNGLTDIMYADRQGSQITVQAKKKLQVAESQNRLETFLNVSISLGDNISSGLAGLLLFESSKDNQLGIEDITQRLGSEKINLEFQIEMKRLLMSELHVNSTNIEEFVNEVERAIEIALLGNKNEELEHIALSFRRVLRRLRLEKYYKVTISPKIVSKVAEQNPRAALIFYRLAKEAHSLKWKKYFLQGLVDSTFLEFSTKEIMERYLDTWVAWLQLLREIGGLNFIISFDNRILRSKLLERALDPSYLLELSKRDPEVALDWIQLAKDIGSKGKIIEKMQPRFFLRAFESRYSLLELIKWDPEVALSWIQLAKKDEYDKSSWWVDPKFFEQAFNKNNLLELRKRNSKATLAWVQLVREFWGEDLLQQIGPWFFEEALNPNYLLELIERSPEAALIWIQLVYELGGEDLLLETDPKFFERAFSPKYLMDIVERVPEVVLAWVKLARVLWSESLQQKINPKFYERALNPRYFLEIVELNPDAALDWIQMVREFGVDRLQRIVVSKFYARTFHPKYLMEIVELSPEAAVAWIRLLCELGGNDLLRNIGSEFFERVFHPRYLLELIEMNPEKASTWMQLTHELWDEGILQQAAPEYYKRIFHPRYLMEIIELSHEAALVWIRLACEVGGKDCWRKADPEFSEQVLNSSYLLELIERSPETALIWMRLAHELGGKDLQRKVDPKFFKLACSLRYLLGLSKQDSEKALACVQMAREIKDESLMQQIGPEFFEQTFHPRYLLELIALNPEVSLAWIQLACEVGAESFLGEHCEIIIDQWSSKFSSGQIFRQKPTAFAVLIKLARITKSPRAIEMVFKCFNSSLWQPERGIASLEIMPLATLSDLQWLAKITGSPEINSALSRYLNEIP